MGRNLIIIFFICILTVGCYSKKFEPYSEKDLSFEKQKPYVIDLDSIKKPEKINCQYLDDNYNEVSEDEATYVLLNPEEYSKIGSLLILCKTYKDIIKEQENIININIDKQNMLYDFIILEQEKKNKYKELWAISEDSYRQEKFKNSIDRYSLYFISSGLLIALLIAL